MQLTISDVQKVARLSRLQLSGEEQARFAEQLGEILNYVALLNEVETADVAPMAHAADLANVFRADVPAPSLERSAALANAPKSDGKYFLVPQILEGA
ncbi:Asp-tRNA(Asn)/Glu-tRNA(Gln) amidotransferase subunit GatC [Planctomicrobium piriforme]|uniref:Aspartyl/glutamyl-tRNA(Asn/Gln) amidotransferase subunit C n=1 Tax=Planctomicrobium piriforme TaxID=1576369 RepID=A0A1I3H0F1_9PLAN|nr:Asp-tRNA(Asn)/Glu-tRNA(Gln) amidotransferase subunit GatC [Planctomicrobium piriforme]SFI29086.1 aspartyl-tRNA(Asn)/glutamyl-tRNA(Gln) amidotransferase subunit C [Planctomicrobium piriforme]